MSGSRATSICLLRMSKRPHRKRRCDRIPRHRAYQDAAASNFNASRVLRGFSSRQPEHLIKRRETIEEVFARDLPLRRRPRDERHRPCRLDGGRSRPFHPLLRLGARLHRAGTRRDRRRRRGELTGVAGAVIHTGIENSLRTCSNSFTSRSGPSVLVQRRFDRDTATSHSPWRRGRDAPKSAECGALDCSYRSPCRSRILVGWRQSVLCDRSDGRT